MKKNSNGHVSPEDFIIAWQTSPSVAEVMKKLNMRSSASCSGRAADYRRRGVPLKKMPTGRAKFDLAALKALAEKYAKK